MLYQKKYAAMFALLILLCIFKFNCDNNPESRIIGKWEEINGTQAIEFLKNGSLIGTSSGGESIPGDYKIIEENKIRLNFSTSSGKDASMIAVFKIVDDELTLVSDQSTLKYKKAWRPPDVVKDALDFDYPGWRFAPVDDHVQEFFKNQHPGQSPVFIKGDFDDNGSEDFAVRVFPGRRQGRNCVAIALLGIDNRLVTVMLGSAGDYILLIKKGTRDWDFAAQKEFIYPRDVIFTGIFERSGWSWLYENGQFKKLDTSD